MAVSKLSFFFGGGGGGGCNGFQAFVAKGKDQRFRQQPELEGRLWVIPLVALATCIVYRSYLGGCEKGCEKTCAEIA